MLGKLLQAPPARGAPASKRPAAGPKKTPPLTRESSIEPVNDQEQDKVPPLATMTTLQRYNRNEELSQQVQQRLREGSQGYVNALEQRERHLSEAAVRYGKTPPKPPVPSGGSPDSHTAVQDGFRESGSESAVRGGNADVSLSDQNPCRPEPEPTVPSLSLSPPTDQTQPDGDGRVSSNNADQLSKATAEPRGVDSQTEESRSTVSTPADGYRATGTSGGLPNSSDAQNRVGPDSAPKQTRGAAEKPTGECDQNAQTAGGQTGSALTGVVGAPQHTLSVPPAKDTTKSLAGLSQFGAGKEQGGATKSAPRSKEKGRGQSRRRLPTKRSQLTARNDAQLAAYICALSLAEWNSILESRVMTGSRFESVK